MTVKELRLILCDNQSVTIIESISSQEEFHCKDLFNGKASNISIDFSDCVVKFIWISPAEKNTLIIEIKE